MRIALVAPPYIPCPPIGYGGVERVVADIADGLVASGHDVTLFAHPESRTRAELITPDVEQTDIFDFQKDALHASAVVGELGAFDVVHNHSVALLLFRRWLQVPMLTTVHGTTHYDAVRPIYRAHKDAAYVSISDRQRHTGLTDMNWIDTVYNGIDTNLYTLPEKPASRDYLLHIGTLCQRKGTAEAVQIALATGHRLVLAGRIDPINQPYFDKEVTPYLGGEQVSYIGEVDGQDKVGLYQNAKAVLCPINWDEPFGLVLAEAGACGTPVLVNDRGAAREVVVDGLTGFVTSNWQDMEGKLDAVASLSPQAGRDHVNSRFSRNKMVSAYEGLYDRLAR